MKKTTLAIIFNLCAFAALINGQSVTNSTADDPAAIEILEKHATALGGRANFERIKSVEMMTERAVLGRTILAKRIYDAAGKRTFQQQNNNGSLIESGFNGTRVWQKAPFFRGYLDESDTQAKSLMRSSLGLPGAVLYNYQAIGKNFARLPDEEIDNVNYLVVKTASTDQTGKETPVKYYFDPATFLLRQIITGSVIKQTETFDDYRQIDGITVAFASSITNPQVTLSTKITELKFNQPFDPDIFEFRETADKSSAGDVFNKSASAVSPEKVGSPDEIPVAVRLETFERVWKTVNDTFYDREFNKVDWQAIHEKYLPPAKTTARSDEFHELLSQMVQELHLSHFKVIPPRNILTLGTSSQGLSGLIGINLRWLDNQLLISAVKPDSPAARAGLRPGFGVSRIDGKTPDEIYAAYREKNAGFQFRENLSRPRAANESLAGEPNTKITLELSDADRKPIKLELVRQAQQSSGRQLEFESKKLAENIGYIRFNLFFGELLPKFQSALEDLRTTRGLIIDLRGNPGGAGDLAPALANLLCGQAGSLGSLNYRYATEQYSYSGAGEKAYRGKVILLTDEGTGSTAEVFAGGLQANHRAVVIGSASAGAVLPSLVALLPTGGALQYVVSDFKMPNGIALEGRGVQPDIELKVSRADLLATRDPVLERATDFLKQN